MVPPLLPYPALVRHCVKPGDAIFATLTPEKAHMLHMLLGLAGEVGELIDGYKKHLIYNKPIDRENLIEELGDIEFYLEGFRQGLNISRGDTLARNQEKLNKRYAEGYSDIAAANRADKAAMRDASLRNLSVLPGGPDNPPMQQPIPDKNA
jgi:NTP pyrophosphatase (non-canonical NTP hydrolase)